MTQAELARAAGVAERTVWLVEQGRGGLDSFLAALEALSLALYCRNGGGETFSEMVHMLRCRRGISREELARIVGVTRPTMRAIERDGARGGFPRWREPLTALGAGAYLAPAGHKQAFYTTAGNSSVGENWETPQELLSALYGVFKFDLDPCSPKKRGPVKARVRFTAEDDGLSLPWHGVVFVNPPYGRTLACGSRRPGASIEERRARAVVLLIPARTDTAYWHEQIAGRASVWFLRGRLKFSRSRQSAPFPSVVVVWGATEEEVTSLDAVIPGRRQ